MRCPHKSSGPLVNFTLLAVLALTANCLPLRAGQEIRNKEIVEPSAPVEPAYEAGRGLLTLQGPSGMFINPTSATLPQGKFTLQYCNFYPENQTEVVAHG